METLFSLFVGLHARVQIILQIFSWWVDLLCMDQKTLIALEVNWNQLTGRVKVCFYFSCNTKLDMVVLFWKTSWEFLKKWFSNHTPIKWSITQHPGMKWHWIKPEPMKMHKQLICNKLWCVVIILSESYFHLVPQSTGFIFCSWCLITLAEVEGYCMTALTAPPVM